MTTTTVSIALLFVCLAFVVTDIGSLRSAKREQFSSLAGILAANTTAALESNDPRTAAELLSALQSQPAVEAACLYDAVGKPLANYVNAHCYDTVVPAEPPTRAVAFNRQGDVEIVQEVRHAGRRIGSLYVRADAHDVSRQIGLHLGITGAVALAALLIAAILASGQQRLLTAPLRSLVQAISRVAKNDYSVRVEKAGNDEIGVLADGFNSMAAQIEAAYEELARAQAEVNELRQSLEVAEGASRSKTRFLANMSHEIRTPMTAILGCAELLTEPDRSPDECRENVDAILRNGTHLMGILNDILDISKIEAGKMTAEPRQTSPRDVVDEVYSLMWNRAAAKGLNLNVEYQGPIPEQIVTDAIRLRQILVNLIGNAIKFTTAGEVRIAVRLERLEPGGARLCFDVIDTGIGLTREQMSLLFKPFSQVDASMTRRYSGSGLGLVISKRLAKMLGGVIGVESTPGQGSRFTLALDVGTLEGVRLVEGAGAAAAAPQGAPAKKAEERAALKARILLVEDGPDNQRIIAHVLRRAGAEVTLAGNGKEAVDMLLTGDSASTPVEPPPFDIVLMDMQMPVMDGYEATRRLRAAGYQRPIIALTAHAMPNDRTACLASGCDDFTTKPIDRAQLVALLAGYQSAARETGCDATLAAAAGGAA